MSVFECQYYCYGSKSVITRRRHLHTQVHQFRAKTTDTVYTANFLTYLHCHFLRYTNSILFMSKFLFCKNVCVFLRIKLLLRIIVLNYYQHSYRFAINVSVIVNQKLSILTNGFFGVCFSICLLPKRRLSGKNKPCNTLIPGDHQPRKFYTVAYPLYDVFLVYDRIKFYGMINNAFWCAIARVDKLVITLRPPEGWKSGL